MKLIEERDSKINERFNKRVEKIAFVNKNKMAKDLLLYVKQKKKMAMVNKLLTAGFITATQHREYLNKITKEWELSKKNVDSLTEILFETDDCDLSSVFSNGEIKYCINQYGMKEYFGDLSTALERFIMLSV